MLKDIIKNIIEEEIKGLIVGGESVQEKEGKLKIVILNRGWVVIGNFYRDGDMCRVENAYFIRRWGTNKGIGQLAIEGKQPNTELDKVTDFDFHILTTVGMFECDKSKWK